MLLIGTVFGSVYLILLVVTMVLQTGHIAFIIKPNEGGEITDRLGGYMMATLSNPYESLLGVFKCIWAIFLGITFWQHDRSEEHTSELQSRGHLVCRLLLEKKKKY